MTDLQSTPPTIHRSQLSPFHDPSPEYAVLEVKLCENCGGNFLRTANSPTKYCSSCR